MDNIEKLTGQFDNKYKKEKLTTNNYTTKKWRKHCKLVTFRKTILRGWIKNITCHTVRLPIESRYISMKKQIYINEKENIQFPNDSKRISKSDFRKFTNF